MSRLTQEENDDDDSGSSLSSISFIPGDYQVFAGPEVDKHSFAATFCNHSRDLASGFNTELCSDLFECSVRSVNSPRLTSS